MASALTAVLPLCHAAGDADECHPCIGYARRLLVPCCEQQADILVQALQDHTPDVIIVDDPEGKISTRRVRLMLHRRPEAFSAVRLLKPDV
jgi:stage III sporulation protein SpoIIIAA